MNSDLLYKIKKYTKKIISIYSYLVIIISLLLLIGGGKINVSDDDPSFIIVGLLFFFIFIIAVFIVVPVFFYYLYKRNFKFIKNQFFLHFILIASYIIGPYFHYNIINYSGGIKEIETLINRGQWDEAYSLYNIIYIRNKEKGIPYIKRCQIKLKEAKFYKGQINGLLSKDLELSVIRFQKYMNLTQDGQLGTYTNTFLVSYISKQELNLPPNFEFNGWYINSILDSCIRSYQKSNNIEVDGAIGPESEKLLLKRLNIPW